MIVMPAVDLREGSCVQLVGGSFTSEPIRLPDPVAIARNFAAAGFSRLHVVDLDAAAGAGSNAGVVSKILTTGGVKVQVGGGLRDEQSVSAMLEAGAASVVLGTRAVEDPEWLSMIAASFPGRVVVAADVRGREVLTRAWSRGSGRNILDTIDCFNTLPLGGVLVTAVHQEGRMTGTDMGLMSDVVAASRAPVIASGGITSLDDLRELAAAGIAGAVVGMALYTGTLDARTVAREFGT